jgi:transcriptional regulator with XRE-family HTH domain
LGWSQQDLAYAAGVQVGVIGQYERIGTPTESRHGFDWLGKIRAALENAGVCFAEGFEPSVRLWDGYAVTPRQCAEARRLLHLSQAVIAHAIGLSQAQVSDFERTGHMARRYEGGHDRIVDLRLVFERGGIEFAGEDGGEPEVRLRG